MKRNAEAAPVTLATILLLSASMAVAQSTAEPGVSHPRGGTAGASSGQTEVGEIVVTADKRSESINRVPLSVQAATGEQLVNRGITQPSDLVKIVSGFEAKVSQVGTPIYFLRGIGFDDVSAVSRPTVTLYSDEAPLPYSAMAIGNTLDLERVEVLKGPQGLLFGSNSTGGAINFIAAKPTEASHYGFDASLGSYLQHNVTAFASGPLNGWLSARLAVGHEGMDDWQYDYVDGKKNGQQDIWKGRLTLDAHPGDRLKVRLTVFGAKDDSDPQEPQFIGYDAAIALPAVRAYPTAPQNDRATSFSNSPVNGIPHRKDDYTWQTTLRADYDLGNNVTLTSLSNFAETQLRFGIDGDGTHLRIIDYAVDASVRTFTQEFRLAGTVGHAHFIAGGNYEHDKTGEDLAVDLADGATGNPVPFLPPLGVIPSFNRQKFESIAGFGNIDYDLTDKFVLHGGLRYTHTRTDFEGCVIQSDPTAILLLVPPAYQHVGSCETLDPTTFIPGLFVNSLPEHNVSWRAGLDYKPASNTLLYANVSRGYKAGTYSAVAATFSSQLYPVPQESVLAYEVGLKSDLVGRLLHVNAALFYYAYDDKQLQGTFIDPIFGALQKLVSVPKSRVDGAEVEAVLRPMAGLSLSGNVTYVDTKVTSNYVQFSSFGVPGNLQGEGFPNTPKWQGSVSGEYRHGVSDSLDGFLNVQDTFRSASNGDFFNDPRLHIDAYNVVDGQIGVAMRSGAWRASIYGRNIFNTYYWTTQKRELDAIVRYTGMPATYGFQLSYRY